MEENNYEEVIRAIVSNVNNSLGVGVIPKSHNTRLTSSQQSSLKPNTDLNNPVNIAVIVGEIVKHLMPIIIKTIKDAVKERGDDAEELDSVREELKQERIKSKIELDRLEQYQRKDSLRINGIPYEDGETNTQLEDKILSLGDKIGVTLNRKDISVTHRLKPTKKGIHPVIIKFSTRRSKDELYYAKKKLKDVDGMDNVFISEDLTRLRYRTLLQAKSVKNFNSITTRGGKIKVYVGESKIPVTLESPMDLTKLELEPDMKFLGLIN